jgi:hypothetical protein
MQSSHRHPVSLEKHMVWPFSRREMMQDVRTKQPLPEDARRDLIVASIACKYTQVRYQYEIIRMI